MKFLGGLCIVLAFLGGCASNKMTVTAPDGTVTETNITDSAMYHREQAEALKNRKPAMELVLPPGTEITLSIPEAAKDSFKFALWTGGGGAEDIRQFREPYLELTNTAVGVLTGGLLGYFAFDFAKGAFAAASQPTQYSLTTSGDQSGLSLTPGNSNTMGLNPSYSPTYTYAPPE